MQEYITTKQACRLLGIPYTSSPRLTKQFHLTPKKQLTYKLWPLAEIKRIQQELHRKSQPPPGWIRLDKAAAILNHTTTVTRSLLLAHGLKPAQHKLWIPKAHATRPIPCWHEKTVRQIAATIRREQRRTAPEGWLTFREVRDYLGADKNRTRTLLRRYKVPFTRATSRHHFYEEDAVIAMRRHLKTAKQYRHDT